MSDLALASADAYCRALTKGHYENFIVASPFVSSQTRLHLARIYGFCRTTDDLGDESVSKADALKRLTIWREELQAMAGGITPVHPVLFALRETIDACNIPLQPFFDLVRANVQDQTVTHYATWNELEAYCRLSAAPVGRMVLAVFGIDDPRAPQLSDDVCIGLQLANHAQDVARDAKIGRRYLIDEDIEASGIPGAVRALVARARTLLNSGRMLETLAPFALRLQLSLYRLGGLAICDGIERLGFRTDESRPEITDKDKVAIILRAFVDALRRNGATEQIETA